MNKRTDTQAQVWTWRQNDFVSAFLLRNKDEGTTYPYFTTKKRWQNHSVFMSICVPVCQCVYSYVLFCLPESLGFWFRLSLYQYSIRESFKHTFCTNSVQNFDFKLITGHYEYLKVKWIQIYSCFWNFFYCKKIGTFLDETELSLYWKFLDLNVSS